MKIQEIRELIRLVDASKISELEFESDGAILKLRKGGENVVVESPVQTVPVAVAVQERPAPVEVVKTSSVEAPVAQVGKESGQDASLKQITSPMVGTFYSSPSPDKDAYVKAGDKVKADSIVCIVEAMKLFNEIEAEISGEIAEVLVEDGQLVEYGQPLFLVRA